MPLRNFCDAEGRRTVVDTNARQEFANAELSMKESMSTHVRTERTHDREHAFAALVLIKNYAIHTGKEHCRSEDMLRQSEEQNYLESRVNVS